MVLDLIERQELPLDRALQAMQWSTALAGASRFPSHFAPGDHFTDPELRRAAARAASESSRAIAAQHRVGLDDGDLDELRRLATVDLRAAYELAAHRPVRPYSIGGARQAEIAGAITSILVEHGITPFLMSGSLLGIIRDGRFMDHDYDVDLGLLPGADVEVVTDAVRRLPDANARWIGNRLEVRLTDGAVCDIFPHTDEDGRWWHETLIHRWWNTPFDLVTVAVDGHELYVPDDAHRYLDENYGSWSRPTIHYDISFDTPNRVYQRSPEALRYLHSRAHRALRQGDRWLLESVSRELRDSFGIDVTEHLGGSGLLDEHRSTPPHPDSRAST